MGYLFSLETFQKNVCSSLEAALSRNEVQPRLIICMTPSGRSSNAENL